jgi:hypothetical protein
VQEIVDYQSPLGSNDVPYPYAVSKDYVYLILENVRIPKAAALKVSRNPNDELRPYLSYYAGSVKSTPMNMVKMEKF